MVVVDRRETNGTAHDHEQIEIKNPVTGQLIGSIPVQSEDDVQAAAARARAAQPAWGALSVKERSRILRRWADLVWQEQDQAIQIIREETGKNEAGALLEMLVIDVLATYYYHQAPRILRPRNRPTLFPFIQRAYVHYKPHGVVGFISPWNYPAALALIDAVAALFAGNAVLLKPSEITPFTALYLVDLMHRVGVPTDIAQVLTGDGRTGAALVNHADYISFTGSTAVGRRVAVRAAERLIPYSLEMGGKDPLIVLNDADLDMAVTSALRGALENAGQMCISIERIYVEAGIYDRFVERALHYVQQVKYGPGDGLDIHMGSMTNLRELTRTEAHIQDALEKGAKILHGGKRRPDLGPLFFEPTILVDVNHTMDVMREETFGPVVPIMRVADADEAIRLANDSAYGLSAAIFTGDLKRGERLARRLDAGDACVNRTQVVIGTPALPSGGQKESGVGRRNGPEGLLRFVSAQSILVDNLFAQKPSLTLADPLTLRVVLTLRALRRHLPFL